MSAGESHPCNTDVIPTQYSHGDSAEFGGVQIPVFFRRDFLYMAGQYMRVRPALVRITPVDKLPVRVGDVHLTHTESE